MVDFNIPWKFLSKDWGKTLKFIALGALMLLIPFVGMLAFSGLSIRLISDAIKKKNEIPEVFDDFGENIIKGLKVFALDMLVGLVFLVIFGLLIGGQVAAIIGTGLNSGSDEAVVGAMFAVMMTILPITLGLIIVAAIIMPGLRGNFAKEDKFSALFNFGKAINLVFGNIGAFLTMILIQIVYGLIVSLITGVIGFTGIGFLLIPPLTTLISSKLIGEWYAEVEKK
ncbi:MAG: DUF4013 domain-containing protein [Nanoarchaeota archaeon]|nr:DUF4013 domain-containing protein [Nanoarchaeota archaeon]